MVEGVQSIFTLCIFESFVQENQQSLQKNGVHDSFQELNIETVWLK